MITLLRTHSKTAGGQGDLAQPGLSQGSADNVNWLPWNHLRSQVVVHFPFAASFECMVPVLETGVHCLPYAWLLSQL